MIELYSGTPGSGKSLHTAKELRSRLRMHKRVIIGNFYVNTKAIKRCRGTYLFVMNDRLTPDRLLQFSRKLSNHLGRRLKEGEILLLVDEAQLLFNSREWQNISRQGWLSFFSQHRHYGYPIKERVEGNFFVGSKKLFAIYDSYNHFDTPGQGQRVSGEKGGPTITLPLQTAEPERGKKEEEDSGLEFIDLDKS